MRSATPGLASNSLQSGAVAGRRGRFKPGKQGVYELFAVVHAEGGLALARLAADALQKAIFRFIAAVIAGGEDDDGFRPEPMPVSALLLSSTRVVMQPLSRTARTTATSLLPTAAVCVVITLAIVA